MYVFICIQYYKSILEDQLILGTVLVYPFEQKLNKQLSQNEQTSSETFKFNFYSKTCINLPLLWMNKSFPEGTQFFQIKKSILGDFQQNCFPLSRAYGPILFWPLLGHIKITVYIVSVKCPVFLNDQCHLRKINPTDGILVGHFYDPNCFFMI